MKESIEDIAADIEFQYGKSNTEKTSSTFYPFIANA